MMQILVCEDDPISAALLQKILENAGYETLLAEDGEKAWALFLEHKARIVLTDWLTPKMDGLSLCREIRKVSEDDYTYIIVLTIKDTKEDLIAVFDAGADEYMTKPFAPKELRARLKTAERIISLQNEHKHFERVLINSRNKFRVVFDSFKEEIVSVDRQFQIVSVNRAFLKERRTTFQQVINEGCFIEDDDRQRIFPYAELKSFVTDVFTHRKYLETMITEIDSDGETRCKEIRFFPVLNETGEVIQAVIVIRDQTEEKRKSEEIVSLNKELQKAVREIHSKNTKLEETLAKLKDTQTHMFQSEKMASIGQLAAGVAHEINNPTGFVSSNLRTLDEYFTDIQALFLKYHRLISLIDDGKGSGRIPDEIEQQADEIAKLQNEADIGFILNDIGDLIRDSREGMERIKKIVIDLKDFSHPGEEALKPADINRGISTTLNVLRNELKYKATVTTHYGSLPLIDCYLQQLNQVFMNVILNAAQAIVERGLITITTKSDGKWIEVEIADTGCGIKPENLPKIFDPFFTTKEVGRGTGLGMNVAYNIIKKHTGTIDVKSEPGKGTVVTIRIPVN